METKTDNFLGTRSEKSRIKTPELDKTVEVGLVFFLTASLTPCDCKYHNIFIVNKSSTTFRNQSVKAFRSRLVVFGQSVLNVLNGQETFDTVGI